VQNFTSIGAGAQGWAVGMRPQKYPKISLFAKKMSQERIPQLISKIFRGFYTTNYPALAFQI